MGLMTAIYLASVNEAKVGDKVNLAIDIQNTQSFEIGVYCVARIGGNYLSVVPSRLTRIAPGAVFTFSSSFVMPSNNVVVTAESIWEDTIDDSVSKNITLAGVSPPPPPPPPSPVIPDAEFRNLSVAIS